MAVHEASVHEQPRLVLLAYGFRPFFLLAGIWAIVPMAVVLWAVTIGAWPAGTTPLFTWHGHEMIIGFVTAAIAGFLLTAVPGWTGEKAISEYRLGGLVALWMAARVLSAPTLQPTGAIGQILAVTFFSLGVVHSEQSCTS